MASGLITKKIGNKRKSKETYFRSLWENNVEARGSNFPATKPSLVRYIWLWTTRPSFLVKPISKDWDFDKRRHVGSACNQMLKIDVVKRPEGEESTSGTLRFDCCLSWRPSPQLISIAQLPKASLLNVKFIWLLTQFPFGCRDDNKSYTDSDSGGEKHSPVTAHPLESTGSAANDKFTVINNSEGDDDEDGNTEDGRFYAGGLTANGILPDYWSRQRRTIMMLTMLGVLLVSKLPEKCTKRRQRETLKKTWRAKQKNRKGNECFWSG